MLVRFLSALAVLALVAGCARFRFTEEQWESNINQRVEAWQLESVGRITAFRFDSWSSLGDRFLIIRSTPFKPYLIELATRCHDLDWSYHLGTKQGLGSTLDAKFDSVFTERDTNFSCRIKTIYPLTREQEQALLDMEQEAAKQLKEDTEA